MCSFSGGWTSRKIRFRVGSLTLNMFLDVFGAFAFITHHCDFRPWKFVFSCSSSLRAMNQLCNKQSPGSQESAVKLALIVWQMRKSQGYMSSRRADVLGGTQKWPVQRRPDAVSFNLTLGSEHFLQAQAFRCLHY